MEIFLPPINLVKNGKWLLAVTSSEATNSVFNITEKNNCFAIGIPGFWRIPNFSTNGNIDTLKELLELGSQNGIELHVKEVQRRGTRTEIDNRGFILAGFDHFKSEVLAKLKKSKILWAWGHAVQNENNRWGKNVCIDIKHTSAKSVEYTIQKGIYEVTDDNLMLKSLVPDDLKVNLTIDDFRQRSNLTTHISIKLTKTIVLLYVIRLYSIPFRTISW